ncbi:MAG TPA: GTP-binding protein [Thermodesulfobacteriota bacterium]|nr:GTP-binding protein [Thermodesulfobacteriota bacterium]
MEVLLVAGFLGAGKTTLIRHLLTSPPKGLGKLALLVNEVGKIGLDGSLLSGLNVDVVELTSGCICCSIKTDFFKAVEEIYHQFAPSHLIVEPTGVAQPGEILDVLSQPPLKDFCRVQGIVTIVDAGFFKAREMLGSFYDRQILSADVILLNKIDLVGGAVALGIEARLEEMNPRAKVFLTRNCSVEPARLFEGLSSAGEKTGKAGFRDENLEHQGFQSFTFEDHGIMDRTKLIRFLESLPASLFRCKGWARFPDSSVIVNYSGGNYRLEPTQDSHPTALVLVGRKCPQDEILEALRKCVIGESILEQIPR